MAYNSAHVHLLTLPVNLMYKAVLGNYFVGTVYVMLCNSIGGLVCMLKLTLVWLPHVACDYVTHACACMSHAVHVYAHCAYNVHAWVWVQGPIYDVHYYNIHFM